VRHLTALRVTVDIEGPTVCSFPFHAHYNAVVFSKKMKNGHPKWGLIWFWGEFRMIFIWLCTNYSTILYLYIRQV